MVVGSRLVVGQEAGYYAEQSLLGYLASRKFK
jgi:hypothetical protein